MKSLLLYVLTKILEGLFFVLDKLNIQVNMSMQAIVSMLDAMLDASTRLGALFLLTILFGIPLGLIVCQGRMSKYWIIREPIKLYLLIMRGTPLLLQLLFVFFVPGFLIDNFMVFFNDRGLNYRFIAAVIAFVINYAAYFAEIFRGGIESIPIGQYEAAKVLGFGRVQTFMKIILPQMWKRVLPAMGNEFMTLVKDTSLAMIIGVEEIFKVANSTMGSQFSSLPLIAAGIFYLVINTIVGRGFGFIEKRLDYYR